MQIQAIVSLKCDVLWSSGEFCIVIFNFFVPKQDAFVRFALLERILKRNWKYSYSILVILSSCHVLLSVVSTADSRTFADVNYSQL